MEKEIFFTIVVEQRAHIQKMEQGMEALLKEKQKWEASGVSTSGTGIVTETSTRTPIHNLQNILPEL